MEFGFYGRRKSTDLLAASDNIGNERFFVETDLSDEGSTAADRYLDTQQRDDIAKLQNRHQVLTYLLTYLVT